MKDCISHLFQDTVTAIKKKEYDFLDQRKMDFDQDYEEFCKRVNELHVSCIVNSLVTVTRFLHPFCVTLLIIPDLKGRGIFITGSPAAAISACVL